MPPSLNWVYPYIRAHQQSIIVTDDAFSTETGLELAGIVGPVC